MKRPQPRRKINCPDHKILLARWRTLSHLGPTLFRAMHGFASLYFPLAMLMPSCRGPCRLPWHVVKLDRLGPTAEMV
jgi:hypothetical protein